MKQSNALQTKMNSKSRTAFTILLISLATQPANAQSTTRNIDVFIGMQYGLSLIIPIAGAVIFLFLLLIYLFRIISKATFMRWSFSVIMAGAAFYLSSILFYIT
ncbi:conjugal transfer protein [Bartonella heixiaziensis]|uniref:conjugal transfer protein n=1 Tax=Bartonella heixiaziensis TaxID=1461000 RepID=UPI0039088DEE